MVNRMLLMLLVMATLLIFVGCYPRGEPINNKDLIEKDLVSTVEAYTNMAIGNDWSTAINFLSGEAQVAAEANAKRIKLASTKASVDNIKVITVNETGNFAVVEASIQTDGQNVKLWHLLRKLNNKWLIYKTLRQPPSIPENLPVPKVSEQHKQNILSFINKSSEAHLLSGQKPIRPEILDVLPIAKWDNYQLIEAQYRLKVREQSQRFRTMFLIERNQITGVDIVEISKKEKEGDVN